MQKLPEEQPMSTPADPWNPYREERTSTGEEAIDVSFAAGDEPWLPPAPFSSAFAPGSHMTQRISPGVDDSAGSSDAESDDIDHAQFEEESNNVSPYLSKPPLVTKWNPYALFLLIAYMGAAGFYFYIRIAFTLKPMGNLMGYGIFIMCVEMLGLTAMLPYAVLLVRSTLPNKTRGLPTAEQCVLYPSLERDVPKFNLHVLIPCYKEPKDVVEATVHAAFAADIPVNATRTIYLCDDAVADNEEGQKLQRERREFIRKIDDTGNSIKHITGRVKKIGEGNGKSNNVNNCLQNHIFNDERYRTIRTTEDGDEKIEWHHEQIPLGEVIVIFDSDMVCKPYFFCKILEVMTEDNVALCLTPQNFTNTNAKADVFNSVNFQFWEYWLPGSDAQGYIACTGTNFCIRARMLAHADWFPTYTITEDYALGMELKRRGYKGRYLMEYMVFGEAPDNIRNVFRQRSRWCKGHMQVFLSRRCPLFLSGLPIVQKFWYSYGTWCYFVSIITIPVFMVAPILALIAGITPLFINSYFAIGATVYYLITFLIQNYCRKLSHLKGLWFANISNTVLWFTYVKAVISVISSKMGLKEIGFKATVKKGEPAPVPTTVVGKVMAATRRMTIRVGTMIKNSSFRNNKLPSGIPETDPLVGPSLPSSTPSAATPGDTTPLASRTPSYQTRPTGPSFTDGKGPKSPPPPSRMARPPLGPGLPATGEQTRLLSDTSDPVSVGSPKKKKMSQLRKVRDKVFLGKSWRSVKGVAGEFKGNYSSMEGTWDLIALTIILLLCLATFAAGVWRLANRRSVGIESYANIGVPMMWAMYNAVPAYLFIHYCFDHQKSLETASSIGQFLQAVLGAGAMAFLWVLLPNAYNHPQALQDTMTFFQAQQTGPIDAFAQANVPWLRASGQALQPPGGWFANGDHIKYTVPVANAATLLAWGYLQFPKAYSTASSKKHLLHNLKWVGTYLRDCYSSSTGEQFVFRVGDPKQYAIFDLPNNTINVDEMQPEKRKVVWTSPDRDPNLMTPNQAFHRVLNKGRASSEIAADVLGSAAAALAAISKVFKNEDSEFSRGLLEVAQKVFAMQATSKGNEVSACSIKDSPGGPGPCWVTAKIKVRVPFVNATIPDGFAGMPIRCWAPDWVQTTCVPAYTKTACDYGKVKGKNFLQAADCCNHMQSTNIWNGTTPKGVCALPGYDYTRPCFVPNLIINSCGAHKLDMNTGSGCGGAGMEVYPSAELCCNGMAMQGRFTTDRPAHGLCAPQLQQCYIPSVSQGTCLWGQGENCTHTGLENIYEEHLGCCEYLVKVMQDRKMGSPVGICNSLFLSPPPPIASPLPSPTASGRRLMQAIPRNQSANPRNSTAQSPPPTPIKTTLSPPSLVNTTLSPPPLAPEEITTPLGHFLVREGNISTTLYNSTYVLDDMAWGAAWLYYASGDPSYLGESEYYLEMHQARELRPDTLTSDPSYYISNWDNMAWATNVLLADITKAPKYTMAVRTFFNTWIGNAPRSPIRDLYQRNVARNSSKQTPNIAANSVMLPDGSICTPTANAEINCEDGIDDDCNGLIDEADLNCPFKPVKYMDKLAWTPGTPLPNAANAAFLALSLANAKGLGFRELTQKKLKCWALGQVDYILGEGGQSYLVGYGKKYPLRPQHRGASCTDEFTCNWGNFYSGAPNPHLLKGALVAGPDFGQPYMDDRTHPSSRVGVDFTAPLASALAGVIQTKVNVQECSQWQGLVQNIFGDDTKV